LAKEKTMSHNRVLLCALVFVAGFLFAGSAPRPLAASPAGDAKAQADQEVLKINAECNDAELRGDVAAMDKCETPDFTHTHANGMVEHKAEYLKGVGSGAHKFLALDLSDVHVRSYGDTAIVDEHMHLRADNSGRIADVQNLVMTVWTRQQGKWREAAWIAVGLPGSRPPASESK
jgi:ketosteroid isomerase-like protein